MWPSLKNGNGNVPQLLALTAALHWCRKITIALQIGDLNSLTLQVNRTYQIDLKLQFFDSEIFYQTKELLK